MTPIIRSGYDAAIPVRIRVGGVNEPLTGYTIKACLKDRAKLVELITDTVQSSSADGADWTNGLLIVEFPLTATGGLTPDSAWIEIAVIRNGKRLPVNDVPVTIETGYVLS